MQSLSRNLFLAASLTAMGIAGANAAGNGSSPKGKPFVSINNQIVEVTGAISSLQDQIDLLVARVDTVEQRVGANEAAIASLQAQNAALQAMASQNASDIASINAAILQLQQANATLQALIAATTGTVTQLQAQLDTNSALIANLQGAVLLAETSVITLGSNLQPQIDNNNALIVALQTELDQLKSLLQAKQDRINGLCPNGQAIQQVLANGSVVCESVGGGASGTLQSTYTSLYSGNISSGQYASIYATCPTGWVVSGAGHWYAYNWQVVHTYTSSNNGAYLYARNNNPYTSYISVVATCLRIVP